MRRVPTAPVAAGSLIGAWQVARSTKVRPLGGVVMAAAAVWCGRRWVRTGPATAGGLLAAYAAAFGLSHPLAKRIGAWPSVLSVSGATGLAAWALGDRREARSAG